MLFIVKGNYKGENVLAPVSVFVRQERKKISVKK